VPERHVPIRTCISCGAKRDKKGLMRLVLGADDVVYRDDRGTKGGRGAYVCKTQACIERIGTGHRLQKAFRRKRVYFRGV
jgi:predicted RNA-binding protein YlxR (DUF448 family)